MRATERRAPRVHIDLVVQVEIEGQLAPALAVNVGMGGMFIEGAPLSYGQFVDIIAELPGLDGPVRLPGVVRWVKDRGVGIQFLQLGAQVTHALSEIVSRSTAA